MHCKNTWVYLVILTKCVKTVNLFARVMFILSGRQTPKRQYSIVPLLGLWFTNVYNITMYYNGTNGTNLYTTYLYIYTDTACCILYTVLHCILEISTLDPHLAIQPWKPFKVQTSLSIFFPVASLASHCFLMVFICFSGLFILGA